MTDAERRLDGGCHCGNVRIVLFTRKPDEALPRRRCQCSFCRSRGAVYTSDPDGRLEIAFDNASDVNAYTFGHGTARFHVCRDCGGVPAVTCEVEGDMIAVVNLLMLEGVEWNPTEAQDMDFEGETGDSRMARRKSGWIRTVRVEA